MYTFGLLCIGLFLLCGVIFKKNIKQNQFAVYFIIIFGSLIGSTIVNGILGLDIPYSKILQKERVITTIETGLWVTLDTIAEDSICYDTILNGSVPIKYRYLTDSLENVTDNYIFIEEISYTFNNNNANSLTINLISDSIPRVRTYKYRREIDSKWIAPFGLPSRGDKTYEVDLPSTPENIILVDLINKHFYEKI